MLYKKCLSRDVATGECGGVIPCPLLELEKS